MMKVSALAILGSLFVLLGAGSASAQCVTAGQHWTFSALGSGGDSVMLGMRAHKTYWAPAICKDGVVYETTSGRKYSTPALAADASVCTGAGADGLSCLPPPHPANAASAVNARTAPMKGEANRMIQPPTMARVQHSLLDSNRV